MSTQRSTTADGGSTPKRDAPPANPEGPTRGASEHHGEPDATTRTPPQSAQSKDSAVPNEAHRHKTPQSAAPVNDYEAALLCVQRGITPVPVPLRTKGAKGRDAKGWQERHIQSVEDVLGPFSPKQRRNIGIKGGEVSGGIVVVDLDDPVAVELAPRFFPPTPTVWGRKGNRASKWMYRIDGGDIVRTYDVPSAESRTTGQGEKAKKSKFLELRGASDHYDLIPPSIHPEGDVYEWEGEPFAEPVEIKRAVLVTRAGLLAATCLFVRAWGEGSRHDLALAVSGLLLKRELDRDTVAEIITTICARNDDHEVKDRLRALDDTAKKLDRDGGEDAVAGVSKLRVLLGEAATDALTRWLDDDGEGKERARRKSAAKRDGRESVAKRLIEIARSAELWHDAQSHTTYATIECDGHTEHYAIESTAYRQYLAQRYYRETGEHSNHAALATAIETVSGLARFEGEAHRTWVRRAEHNGAIYIDLCDDKWRVVRVTTESLDVLEEPKDIPVKFVRRPSLRPLPVPDFSGTLDDLRPFFPEGGDKLMLVVGSILSTYRPDTPQPITIFTGEKGAGKSWRLSCWRALTDPCVAARAGLPSNEDNLVNTAAGEGCFTADNVSRISPEMADALCRLSTGGGNKKRTLYTNSEQTTLEVRLPVAMTAINNITEREDFLDRVIHVDLQRAEGKRRTEDDLTAAFEAARPRILGALLKGVQTGLRRLSEVQLDTELRMLDHLTFVEAAAPAFGWKAGDYVRAYSEMHEALFTDAAHADVFTQRFAEWAHGRPIVGQRLGADGGIRRQPGTGIVFRGSMAELFQTFDGSCQSDPLVEHERRQRWWPTAPNKLSARLRDKRSGLVRLGIDFDVGLTAKKTTDVIVRRIVDMSGEEERREFEAELLAEQTACAMLPE